MKKLLYSLTLFLIFSNISFAQVIGIKANVLSDEKTLRVRWFNEDGITPNKTFVYIAYDNGNWELVNPNGTAPICQLSDEAYKRDNRLEFYTEIVQKQLKSKGAVNDFAYIICLSLAVENNDFANYLGIQSELEFKKDAKSAKIQLRNEAGKVLTESEPIVLKYIELKKVNDLKAKIVNKTVDLNWQCSLNDFYAYNVYRKNANSNEKIRVNKNIILVSQNKNQNGQLEFPEVLFTDSTAKIGNTYNYTVSGIDLLGFESEESEPFQVTMIDPNPPLAAFVTKIELTKSAIEIEWKNPEENSSDSFQIYLVNEESEIENAEALVSIKGINKAQIAAQAQYGQYYLYVATVSKFGIKNYGYSNPVYVFDKYGPNKPTNLTIKSDTGIIILNWDPATEGDFSHYRIYRKTKSAYSFSPYKITWLSNSFTDSIDQKSGDTYLYKILAFDTLFNSSDFSDTVEARLPDVTPPQTPKLIDYKVSEASIEIIWTNVFDDDLKGFIIFRKDGENDFKKITSAPLSSSVSHYTDILVQPGIKYTYKLISIDQTGNKSDFSNEFHLTIEQQESFEMTIEKFGAKVNQKKNRVDLSWKMSGNPDAITLFRAENGQTLKPLTGALSVLKYRDNSLEKGKNYQYQLRAYTPDGQVIKSSIITIKIN